MAALLLRPKPLDLPDFAFADGDGEPKSLADFAGKVVLLNIWATWCVPCREEMPALDKLETKLGGKDFEVVAVNIDKGGPDKAAAFLKETGATHLALYTDPTGKLFATIKAVGMPTTLIIDRERQGDRPPGRPGRLGLAGSDRGDRGGRSPRRLPPPTGLHRDDGVLVEAIGVFAGLGDRLVARHAWRRDVEHALAAGLAEFVALHEILEHEVPVRARRPRNRSAACSRRCRTAD